MKLTGVVLLATLSLAGGARAQAPAFISLDRMDDQSRLGVQLGLHEYRSLSGTPLRLELFAQDVRRGRPWGLYGQVAMVRLFSDQRDENALQGIEFGAFALLGELNVLRLGLSLPTADPSIVGTVANILTMYERLGDLANAMPESMWLRASYSRVQRMAIVTLRVDAGFDFRLDGVESGGSPYEDRKLARLGIGAALAASPDLALTVESQNLMVLSPEEGGDATDWMFHALTLGIRTQGRTQLHAGWVLPLDAEPRGDLWLFTVGIQRLLGL